MHIVAEWEEEPRRVKDAGVKTRTRRTFAQDHQCIRTRPKKTTRTAGFPTKNDKHLNPRYKILGKRLHPIVRHAISFFTLPRNKRTQTNSGICFLCFRSRALYDRFAEIMDGVRLGSNSVKQISCRLAKMEGLEELKV